MEKILETKTFNYNDKSRLVLVLKNGDNFFEGIDLLSLDEDKRKKLQEAYSVFMNTLEESMIGYRRFDKSKI